MSAASSRRITSADLADEQVAGRLDADTNLTERIDLPLVTMP